MPPWVLWLGKRFIEASSIRSISMYNQVWFALKADFLAEIQQP
jgi:hypothetical protein